MEKYNTIDVKCVEVNWGREKLQCHGVKRTHSMRRERGKRGVERAWFQVQARRKHLPTRDWEVRGIE